MKIFAAYFVLILAFACAKKESDPNPSNPNNPATFTPPTVSYFKVDGKACNSSADIAYDYMSGGNISVSKPFNEFNRGQLRVYLMSQFAGFAIIDSIPEGGWKLYPISATSGSSVKDSIRVEVDIEGGGNYFFKASAGQIYISKKDGKLRYTSKGAINLTGYKYLENPRVYYSKTTEFSIRDREGI